MENKKFKSINFTKSGAGNLVGKIILPKKWLDDMEINIDNPFIELSYNENQKQIIIEKKK
ncbi:hypothetical protein [Fusobacterium perfoetens]|uniref:hypothetical protein n=1 Tax=Fusobacterium perfoetens TaxID=852 RepID=UPI000483FDA0|nr:hypothetical protein [Fusobacterium perfoetens]MCI6152229.1 dihydrolipoamide acetyltransferase [Fusobacterium perfoetens]MDY3237703.1 dihydrolipoamide acetyltransferase [Fusobacterium perfoetens]